MLSCKKLMVLVLFPAFIAFPAYSIESETSTYISDGVKIGSGILAGAFVMYCAWVRPQQKKIKNLKEKQSFFKKALNDQFVYFNRTPENVNKLLSNYGINDYKAELAKFDLNNHTCNLFSVIKKVEDKK